MDEEHDPIPVLPDVMYVVAAGEHAIPCGEIHTPPAEGPRPDGYLTAYFALVAAFVRDVGHCPMLVAICKVGYPPYNTVEGAATGIRNAIERHEPAFKGIVWCRNHFSETEFLAVAQPQ